MDNDEFFGIKDLDRFIAILQYYREKYGNLPVYMDMSCSKEEGSYDIDAVLYGYDEDGEESIGLISW